MANGAEDPIRPGENRATVRDGRRKPVVPLPASQEPSRRATCGVHGIRLPSPLMALANHAAQRP